MIVRLRGTLIEKTPAGVVIDVGGVGYAVTISLTTYDRLPIAASEVDLHIYHHIREDGQTLFGFNTPREKEMFTSLISVSGVGPRLAVNLLSGLTAAEIATALVDRDVKRLSAISGIGKKTAERLIVELRDKINPLEALAGKSGAPAESAVLRDTVLSLTALGYTPEAARKMAQTALDAHPAATDTQTLLKAALKK